MSLADAVGHEACRIFRDRLVGVLCAEHVVFYFLLDYAQAMQPAQGSLLSQLARDFSLA